ncbi:MAG: pyridoxal phosphate-dependent aminotransferase family protein [Proteobacteria bacterium]|nr:pyridoxal phosphate-dependent aminotransferase family protein [Pseudomonadota bacterium]MBU4384277.1 pyridoxal phosphate-dependent aminotransferase family protein [Pseudomonadota bacterium]MCG2764096.1 pyridoxal phosphate-dependent aminotransferase family protein [Desulfarculaceae bacterium]
MDLFEKCAKATEYELGLKQSGHYLFFRKFNSPQDSESVVNGKRVIMIGSNNYLGLANHPRVKEAAIKAIEKYGTGCSGSRFLNGNLDIHEELENKLATFFRKEAALVFSTGYQTNLGTISSLIERNDIVIMDKGDHASIIDGCRLSFGKVHKFRHNDMDDLERLLDATKVHHKLIIVDGVFSMDGDLADLPNIVRLAKAYGAKIMVDDAHAIGVLGKGGRGTAEHFGLESEVDIIMGTFSKSLAAIGGFVAGRADVICWIKHLARSMIFSAALPSCLVASVSTALDIIKEQPELIARLWRNTNKMLSGLKSLGYDTGMSETPIIPIFVGDTMKTYQMCKLLYDNGVFVNPVISPAVPAGRELLRTSYMATHTEKQLDTALAGFEKVGKQVGVI